MEVVTKTPSASHFLSTTLTFLLLTSHVRAHAISTSTVHQSPTSFINKSCNTTTYPSRCIKTLTPFASSVGTNPVKLCKAALTVAIRATINCSATVSKLYSQRGIVRAEAGAIKDCIGDMKDAVYELKQTVKAMAHLGDADSEFQRDNAKTYASAAIADAETCVDGFLDRKVDESVKKMIGGCVSGAEKLISNGLARINHLY